MRHFRASDGAELAYSRNGAGSPSIVFVHGWQAEGDVWMPIVEALGPSVDTISVDLRGFGESRAAAGPFSLERCAADLRELIETLGIAPVVIAGHSMGATVALRLAVDTPQLACGLVLIAPVPASGGGYSPKGEAYLKATAGDPAAARNWLGRTFARAPDETALERLCAAAAKTDRAAALESFESWAYADFAESTRSILAPALVIAPQYDNPDVSYLKVAALLSNARYVALLGCAHYAIVEKPREIAELILTSFETRAARAPQDDTEIWPSAQDDSAPQDDTLR
jgi:pimeloyl-ACP methyl ester carboxylesterase